MKRPMRAIFACDEDWGIGLKGDLPWPHNPEDLNWFKQCTLGGTVIMGSRTWSSLPKRPLPNRNNVLITTSNKTHLAADWVGDLHSFLKTVPHRVHLGHDLWVIGGAQLLESVLPYVEEIWLSRIEGVWECDTHLPYNTILEEFVLDTVEEQGTLYIEKWSRK